MAGFVKRNSAQRWNRAASIVEAAGAGSHFVRGVYRQPFGTVCDQLAPGSYPAVAGASIAAGATGVVVYDGGVYSAVNQSQCPVVIGDKVGLHVSPSCEAFFVPCVCNCNGEGPANCCQKIIAVCVNNETQLVEVDGGEAEWILSEECCGTDRRLIIHLTCTTSMGVSSIVVYWSWVTVDYVRTTNDWQDWPQWQWSELCSDPPETKTSFAGVCGLRPIFVTASPSAAECECVCPPCSGPDPPAPPTDCCSQSLWFCLNGDSQQLAVNGGTYTWDISDCCDCTTATFEVMLSCNESTDVITLQYEFDCDGVIQTGSENTLMSTFCTGQAPQILTFLGLTCFIQLPVTITEFTCSTCEPTATTPPPP
jgi:hypothetical protein